MDQLLDTLNKIHYKVSSKFTYETDQDQYGVAEKWVMPGPEFTGGIPVTGDCEDFALACRKLCRDAGIRSRLVLCLLEGEGHCVLEVDGWILCNNQSSVRSRDNLTGEYQWWAISGYEPGDEWRLITN